MKKIALILVVILLSASAQAHLPMTKKIGYDGIGFYPLCSSFNTETRTYNIPENTSKLFLIQYMGYSLGEALPVQPVHAVLTSNVRKYPADDRPNLGIYERTLGESGYFQYAHQYHQYLLMDSMVKNQTSPCWLLITDLEFHSDTCDVTGN